MPNDDNGQVFDVSKPNRVAPDPTGRPIIVGHQPMISDPMMRDGNRPPLPAEHKSIPVMGANMNEMSAPTPPPIVAEHPESVAAASGTEAAAAATVPPGDLHLASVDGLIGHEHHQPGHHSGQPNHRPPADGSVSPPAARPPKKSGKKGLWFLLILIILVVGAYLAIDSRLIKTSIKLPFHVFKQPAPAVTPPVSTPAKTSPAVPAIPAGFTAFQLTGTTLSFDYPTIWGTPAVTTDPGYSSRSTTAKSDGTYAYLVNFATNKDVQMAVTSSKYLPVSRTPLYYDYLQWCVGTNDAKFYKSVLHFTTTKGVDTPSTTTCDQGPLNDASKLNDFTIVQLKTTNPDGTPLGDLYTENLKEADLPVLRVKDAASTNGDNIKKMLATIKSSDSSESETSSGQ